MLYRLVLCAWVAFMTISCSHKAVPNASIANNKQQITIEFNNVFENKPIELNTENYTNKYGEKYSVSLLQYYISNIKLIDRNKQTYIVPQDSSYFLIQQSNASTQKIELLVPTNDYEEIQFVLGIDSLRNTKPLAERKGVLDPATYSGAEGMYWSWNSGYIFFKMEGNKIADSIAKGTDNKFRYHIGLFGGMDKPTLNNIKNVSLMLPQSLNLTRARKKRNEISIEANIAKVFSGTEEVSLTKYKTVMAGPASALIANNYASMFSVRSVK